MQTTLFTRQSVREQRVFRFLSEQLGSAGWIGHSVTQLDQQSIGAASDEYEPVPRSFSTQVHSVEETEILNLLFPCSINILAERANIFSSL